MRFVKNPALEKLLENGPEMVVMLQDRANQAAEIAKDIAPVDTGEYRERIVGEAGIEGSGAKGRLNAYKFTSGFIEFGTSKMQAFAVLRRAIDQLGLKMTSSR